MVEGNVLAFAKGKAKETIRGEKRGFNHVFKLQIGPDLAFVEIERAFSMLLGVVAPIPWRNLEIPAFSLPRLPAKPLPRAALAPAQVQKPIAKARRPLAGFSPLYRPSDSAQNSCRARSACNCTISAAIARLSVDPSTSPRPIQARKAFPVGRALLKIARRTRCSTATR
jgi:hypothetical protein